MGCGGAALPVDRRRNRFGARCGAGRRLWGVAAPCPLLLARGSGAQDTASPRRSQDGRCYFVTAAAPPRYLCAVASRKPFVSWPIRAPFALPPDVGERLEGGAWERKFIRVDTDSKNAPHAGIVTDARRRWWVTPTFVAASLRGPPPPAPAVVGAPQRRTHARFSGLPPSQRRDSFRRCGDTRPTSAARAPGGRRGPLRRALAGGRAARVPIGRLARRPGRGHPAPRPTAALPTASRSGPRTRAPSGRC
jgi:hypothetical protein